MTTKSKPTLLSCIRKTSTLYYKIIAICIGAIAGIAFAIYALATVFAYAIPVVVALLISIPMWAYIPVVIIAAPVLVATVVCYVNRKKNDIADEDADLVCLE
jgi:hypothetical protein